MSDNIDIVVRDSGVEVVVRDLRNVGQAASGSSKDVDLLNSALKALGTFLAVDKVMHWADAWNSVAGLIRTTTKSLDEANTVQERLYQISQKTRQPIEAMASLYNRMSIAGSALGASQEDLLKFTEGVGKSLIIQHSTAQQAAGSLLQLGQMMGMGTIRAQEYNSLFQNGVVILQTAAAHIKGTGGTVAGLTAMVKKGNFPVKEFFQGFLAGAGDLDAKFKQTSYLFSQAFTVMENAISRYIGKLDEANGVSTAFSKFAIWFSDNIPMIAAGVTALGVALAVAFAPGVLIAFIGYLKTIFLLVLSNPFTALIAAIAALITYVAMYGDEINAGIDKTTSLKDVGRSLVESLQSGWQSFLQWLPGAWETVTGAIQDYFGSISASGNESTQGLAQSYSDFFSTTRTGWAAAFTYIAKTIDAIAGLLMGIGVTIANVFTGLPTLFGNIFNDVYNAVVSRVQDMVNASIDAVNKIGSLVGKTLVDHVELATKDVDTDYWKKYGQNIASGIDQGFEIQGGFMEKQLDGILARAKQIGDARNAAGQKGPADLTKLPGGTPPATVDAKAAAKAARELEKLKNALSRVIAEVNPAALAQKHLADAQKILTEAVSKHLIKQGEADKIMAQLNRRYQDQLNPIGAVTRKLEEQHAAYQLIGDQAIAQQQMLPIIEELRQKGVDLTDKQTKSILSLVEANVIAQRQQQAQNSVLEETINKQRQYIEQLDAIGKLKASKTITSGQSDQATVGAFGADAMANTKELMGAQAQSYEDMMARIETARQAGVISEQTAQAMMARARDTHQAQQLSGTQQFLGGLSALMNTHSKKAFAVGKAAAIGNAIIDTYKAATGAYSAMASIPYVGPFLGAAAAAAAIASGIANVSAIRSQQMPAYRTGGSYTVGGSGGTDSQTVAFRATPGERVQINTPAQARALENAEIQTRRGPSQVIQNVTQVIAGKPDRKTPEQYARSARRELAKEYGNN